MGYIDKCLAVIFLMVAVLPTASATNGSALKVDLQAPIPPSLDRPLQLAVEVRNGGATTLALPNGSSWSEPHGLSLQITQVNGASRAVPPGAEPAAETVTLAPGHAVEVSRTLEASAVFFAGAGDYALTVTYTGPLGSVSSETLRVSVH